MTPVHVASDAAIEAAMRTIEARWPGVPTYIVHKAINAAYAVDAPDDTDLATRVLALADKMQYGVEALELGSDLAPILRALVGEPTGPTLHDRIEAEIGRATSAGPGYVTARRLRAVLEAHDTGEPQ
jgi:hypothetical protein